MLALAALPGFALRAAEPIPPVRAFVSILPQQYFVERVGGDRVQVDVLVQPGQSHETYEPTPKQMARMSDSQVYFRIGLPFEGGIVPKIESTMKNLKIVDMAAGVPLRHMESFDRPDGGVGPDEAGGGHGHEGDDPHTWLSPRLVMIEARTICQTLAGLDPAGKPVYEMNLQAFLTDLEDADKRLARALEPVRGKAMMVFHPAWGYFADAYGLRQAAIEVEGKAPSARQLARIIDEGKRLRVKAIFVQPEFDPRSARTIGATIGAKVVVIDSMAKDYFANLDAVAVRIRDGLSAQE